MRNPKPGNLHAKLSMLNAHIIGLGRSGISAARLLKWEGYSVTVSDRTTSESLQQQQQQLADEGITVKLGDSLDLDASDFHRLLLHTIWVKIERWGI